MTTLADLLPTLRARHAASPQAPATVDDLLQLAEQLAAVVEAVEDNARLADVERRVLLRDRDEARAGIVTLVSELERWRHGKMIEGDYVCEYAFDREQLNAARADVQRLRGETESARAKTAKVVRSMEALEADRDVFRDHASDMKRERDAARTDVERLIRSRGIVEAERDAALAEVQRLTTERDAHFACAEQIAVDRDRLAAEVKTIAETTEAALTKRIAAWLYDESSNLASMAHTREANDRNQRSSALANAADSLRAGTWKEPT